MKDAAARSWPASLFPEEGAGLPALLEAAARLSDLGTAERRQEARQELRERLQAAGLAHEEADVLSYRCIPIPGGQRASEGGTQPPGQESAGRRPHLVVLSDVEPETVKWLWRGRIPLGKLTILDGDPGLGKSSVGVDLSARVSRCDPLPDGSRSDLSGPAGVVLLSAEDGLRDTIRPRLDAAGADVDRVVALSLVSDGDDGERLPTVADTGDIEVAIRSVGARLVVVDPLVAYLGLEVNSHRDQDVRSALAGLAKLAERLGVAVLAIRHLNKGSAGNPLYRGGGSIGLIAAARSGLLVAKDPKDPDGGRRILASTKSNLAAPPPSLAYRLEPVGDTVRVSWEGESDHSASELLAAPDGEERSRREEATRFLRLELAAGPVTSKELQARVRDAGLSWRTVRRAAKDMGVRMGPASFGKPWEWELPPESSNLMGLADTGDRTPQEGRQDAGSASIGQTTRPVADTVADSAASIGQPDEGVADTVNEATGGGSSGGPASSIGQDGKTGRLWENEAALDADLGDALGGE